MDLQELCKSIYVGSVDTAVSAVFHARAGGMLSCGPRSPNWVHFLSFHVKWIWWPPSWSILKIVNSTNIQLDFSKTWTLDFNLQLVLLQTRHTFKLYGLFLRITEGDCSWLTYCEWRHKCFRISTILCELLSHMWLPNFLRISWWPTAENICSSMITQN